jgi:Putative methyltransferase
VQEPLLLQVADSVRAARGQCYIASDVQTLAAEMRQLLDSCESFERDERLSWTADGWLCENPFSVATERETAVLSVPGADVYRAMFRVAA